MELAQAFKMASDQEMDQKKHSIFALFLVKKRDC